MSADPKPPTYHDLHITTPNIPRTSVFNLPYGLMVACTRTSGWQLWQGTERFLAGEYGGENWLVLDVDGHVICDGRRHADQA